MTFFLVLCLPRQVRTSNGAIHHDLYSFLLQLYSFIDLDSFLLQLAVQACGFGGNLLRWIENWLKDRRQRVGIRGAFSEWMGVISGVPQGSVLGPLLFIIFINCIDKGVLSKISKFADDTKLCKDVVTEEDASVLREDLRRLYEWAKDWQMLCNIDKCSAMHMGRGNKKLKYDTGGLALRASEEERDLGAEHVLRKIHHCTFQAENFRMTSF